MVRGTLPDPFIAEHGKPTGFGCGKRRRNDIEFAENIPPAIIFESVRTRLARQLSDIIVPSPIAWKNTGTLAWPAWQREGQRA